MTCLWGLLEKALFSLKETWQHGFRFVTTDKPECFRKMFFRWTRQKWRCLIIMRSATFGENQGQPISTNTSYQLSSALAKRWWFGLVLQPQGYDPKHSSKSTAECLKKKRIKMLQRSSQSRDVKRIETLRWDLERAVCKPQEPEATLWKIGREFWQALLNDWMLTVWHKLIFYNN